MKPRLILLSLLAAAVVSCGDESNEKNGVGNPQIGFSTQLPTKGSMTNSPAGLAGKGGFNVWAYTHSDTWVSATDKTALLDGTTVTGSDDGQVWSYGAPADWPISGYVSFFAYAPASSATVTGTTSDGIPALNYTVSSDATSQNDLLFASPIYNQRGAMYSYAKNVSLYFNHVLSRISFSGLLLNERENRIIKVKQVVLNGIYEKGSTALSYPVSWTPDEGSLSSYTVGIETGELADQRLTNNAEDLTTANGYLFLIPQIIARDTGLDPTMDVTLYIDNSPDDGEDNGVDITYSSIVFSPGEWLPGKSYNYQIILDGDHLRIIVIDTDMVLEEWSISVVIQPVPLVALQESSTDEERESAKTKDLARIKSALAGFAYVKNNEIGTDMQQDMQYFGLFLANSLNHDLEIDMTPYEDSANGFKEGDVVMFDAKKVLNEWGSYYAEDDVNEENPINYTLKIKYDTSKWSLENAAQPYAPGDDPASPTLDAVTYATTLVTEKGEVSPNQNNPSPYIMNKGSIVLKRNSN
jgi:hypothetical protein